MSEQRPQEPRSLEMRIAAIEDKLARLTVSEDEMRAYQKVAGLISGRAPMAAPMVSCVAHINPIIHIPWPITIPTPIHIPGPIIQDCIQAGLGGAVAGGAGFARLGQ